MKLTIPGLFKRRWFQLTVVLLLILGAFFYWQFLQNKKNGLETYQVDRRDLEKFVSASGKITAEKQVTLRFQTTGRLEWVGVKKGDRVEQWQAIATLNQIELEKRLKKELLDYMNTRWDFDETQNITYKDLVLTEAIRIAKEKSQFDLDLSVLDVELADLAKKYAVLITPIAGIVTSATDEQPGINVSVLNTTYEITDPESLRFTAEVEELDIGLIEEGMKAIVNLDAFPDDFLESSVGPIEFTSTETTGGSTAYEIHFAIPVNEKYRLNMNGDVEISIEKRENALAVPVEAVKDTGTEKLVTLIMDNKQKEIPVEIGLETDDYYEITNGLKEGDVVLLP